MFPCLQVIWVCILCRKKQELLSKTGQWINKGMAGGDPVMRLIEADLQQAQTDKRPKLERAHSAAEKENQPLLQRSGSMLRRQYSQQDEDRQHQYNYHGELEGLMRTHQQYRNDSLSSEQSSSVGLDSQTGPKKHKRGGSGKRQGVTGGGNGGPRYHQQPQPPQRSFSSSDDELRSTPDCTSCEEHESEKGRPTPTLPLYYTVSNTPSAQRLRPDFLVSTIRWICNCHLLQRKQTIK